MYNHIYNPSTGKKHNLSSKQGKDLLNNYINNIDQNGGRSSFDSIREKMKKTNFSKDVL